MRKNEGKKKYNQNYQWEFIVFMLTLLKSLSLFLLGHF